MEKTGAAELQVWESSRTDGRDNPRHESPAVSAGECRERRLIEPPPFHTPVYRDKEQVDRMTAADKEVWETSGVVAEDDGTVDRRSPVLIGRREADHRRTQVRSNRGLTE